MSLMTINIKITFCALKILKHLVPKVVQIPRGPRDTDWDLRWCNKK